MAQPGAAKSPAPKPASEKPSGKAKGKADAAGTPPAKPAPLTAEEAFEEEGAFSNPWYWVTFAVSLTSIILLWLYYSSSFPWYISTPYWLSIILAMGLFVWSGFGLLTRYRVVQRIGAGASRIRERGDTGEEEGEVIYRENIVVRLFKLVGRLIALLFLFVWNTLMRIVYIIETTILRAIILGYDIIYYLLYFAWVTTNLAVRLAFRIIRLALWIAWKILKVLTKFPLARGLWNRRYMPHIMGRWNARMAAREERHRARLDQRRRLVAARGLDPDKWQADWEARHRFPLPHPHEARKGLRERIAERQKIDFNRRDRWRAYRKGQPIPPKMHSERRKRKQEEQDQQRKDEREKRTEERGRRGQRKSSRSEKSPLRGTKAAPVADE